MAKKAIDQLVQNSRLKTSFFILCGLSCALATLGILLNDIAVLISAMVLAPLLNPVLAFAAGISIRHWELVAYSLKSLLGSIIFSMAVSALMVRIFIYFGHSVNLSAFVERFSVGDPLFFVAAFVSGFAGVYAWLRDESWYNLIGVAIAVSLIPFVSFLGIILSLDPKSIVVYLQNFTLNLAMIVSGALMAFIILGFSREGHKLESRIEKEVESTI